MNKIIVFIIFLITIFPKICISGMSIDGVIIDGIKAATGAGVGGSNSISITTPVQYQTFQRSGSTGTITITGTYTGNPTAIEASFNGGAYSTIDSTLSDGTYSGSLTSQAQGQGTLTVRFTNATSVSSTKTYIGIGEVFLVAGQSNAVGQGTSNQTYSSTDGFKATLFGNDYKWKELVDPYDSNTNQVDTISSDTALGSWVLLLATSIMNNQHVPVAFIPSAKGGSGIDEWQPGVNHQNRSTLYGSSVYRTLQAAPGGIRAILWWQGEHEANAGNTQSYYYNYFSTLASSYLSDLGVKIMPCKLQNSTAILDAQETEILNAIGQAWLDTSTTLTGPDFSDINSNDSFHLKSNGNLSTAASRWYTAIATELGW